MSLLIVYAPNGKVARSTLRPSSPCSASALLGLHGFELLRSDEVQLGLHSEEELLVVGLFLLFALQLDLLAQLLLRLLEGLLDLDLLLLLLPLLPHRHTLRLHIVALDNLVVPEALDLSFLVLLGLLQVHGHLLEIECAVSFVAIGHQLGAVRCILNRLLELEVGDGLRGQVHLDGGLVRLIVEVPDVDAVVLRDEDDAWAGG